MSPVSTHLLRLALPKGRMQDGVFALLRDAGLSVDVGTRGYRPRVPLPDTDVKLLKPQNIVEMLQAGTRDVGFAGADWVAELADAHAAPLVELLDTDLDPVRLVVAAPPELLRDGRLPARRLTIASEFVGLTTAWVARQAVTAQVVRSYGATEVFPPEDADAIVDLAASGSTLRANNLVEVDTVMTSSTRLYASAAALADPERRPRIDALALLVASVLEARRRAMLELNVSAAQLEAVVAALPCMREPTVAPLAHGAGYAVRAAVPRAALPGLIVELKRRGGTDLVVTPCAQIVP
jgi:ATP phosphoribosyltransferase